MSKKKDFDNTVLAMSEWLDERMDGYLMLLTKDGQSGMIMNGEADDVTEALASGMVDHEELRAIVLRAVGMAMHELDEINHCGEDINDINLN
jgi:hypothetical protein